jgi:Acetyltransferase (isoleucine patch superfamily)
MNVIKKILYSKIIKMIMYVLFSIFYDKKYLKGYYFQQKRMGWYWAWRGITGRLFGNNRKVPFPVNPNTIVSADRVHFDIDNINIFQTPGCYWQMHDADIYIGSGSYIAPNVGIITSNHDIYNISQNSKGKNIYIGKECWVGMNSVVLPGVILGDHTVVAAGAVVTKSFEDGYCVIGGVPAKIIKYIDRKCIENEKKRE